MTIGEYAWADEKNVQHRLEIRGVCYVLGAPCFYVRHFVAGAYVSEKVVGVWRVLALPELGPL